MNAAIGIDPGIDTGGISLLTKEGLTVIMTPRIGGSDKGDIDLVSIACVILDAADYVRDSGGGMLVICVEDVHSIFQSSASSNFTFGGRRREPNALFAMLAAVMSRFDIYKGVQLMLEETQPKTWQKEIHTAADKVYDASRLDTKATSIRAAQRLFPTTSFTKPWSGSGKRPTKVQDGMCDAALIAEYVRRKFKLF